MPDAMKDRHARAAAAPLLAAWLAAVAVLGTCVPVHATSADEIGLPRLGGTLHLHTMFVASDEEVERATSGRLAGQDDVPPPSYGTPSSSASPCSKGQIEFDARYIYTCVATNAWTRTLTSSF